MVRMCARAFPCCAITGVDNFARDVALMSSPGRSVDRPIFNSYITVNNAPKYSLRKENDVSYFIQGLLRSLKVYMTQRPAK